MIASVKNMPGQKRFRRMTLLKRGHIPNTLRLRPILEVTTDENGIALTRGGRQYRYKWTEITSARIFSEESFKGYGSAASGKFIKRTFILESADGARHAFDVSKDFPDFENNEDLLESLREYLIITESSTRLFNYPLWVVLAILTLIAGVALKKFGL